MRLLYTQIHAAIILERVNDKTAVFESIRDRVKTMNEPRVYRHSLILMGLLILLLGLSGIGLLFVNRYAGYAFLFPLAGILGIVYMMSISTAVSDDEISTRSLFGTKSLRWSEISRISGSGNAVKLHNFDGDVTVSPNVQLPGYAEIVEWIGTKRPDLFDPRAFSEIKRGVPILTLLVVLALLTVGILIGFSSAFLNTPGEPVLVMLPILLVVIINAILFWMVFSMPQSVTLNESSMLIKYLLREKTLPAAEITSVELQFTQTRNGKDYFVALNLAKGKPIRISGLRPNAPVVYHVLKNWHKKYVRTGLEDQRN